jgi:Ca2+-binding RTX toxin-like protein
LMTHRKDKIIDYLVSKKQETAMSVSYDSNDYRETVRAIMAGLSLPTDNLNAVDGQVVLVGAANTRYTDSSDLIFGLDDEKGNILTGGKGNDTLYGSGGDDLLSGGEDNDVMYGEGGNDVLFGDEGNDVLYAGDGNDYLVGGTENDVIYGGKGNDTLEGGTGNDILKGGENDDTYIIGPGDGQDVIEDKEGKNKVYFCGEEINFFYQDGDGYVSISGNLTASIVDGHFDVTDGNGTTVRLNENFDWGDFGTTLVTLPVNPDTTNSILGSLTRMDSEDLRRAA